MKNQIVLNTIIGLLILQSCGDRHEKKLTDSKSVFKKEHFIEFSSQSEQSIKSIFQILTDSINSIVPLNEKEAYWTSISENGERTLNYYKYQNDCKTIYLKSYNAALDTLNKNLSNLLKREILKLDGNFKKTIEVCNNGLDKKPRINMRIKSETVKGDYSYHLIKHGLSNNTNRATITDIKSIEEELMKTKMLNEEIVYWIGVSSEIGFLD